MVARENTIIRLASMLVLLLAVMAITTGCGRRGGLEAPPSAKVVTTDEQGNAVEKAPEKPEKPFLLDPLL